MCSPDSSAEDCSAIAPGQTASIRLLVDEQGQVTKHYSFTYQAETVDVTVDAYYDDAALHGCSVSAVGAGRASQTWGWLAGLGLVLPFLRRRRRPRSA